MFKVFKGDSIFVLEQRSRNDKSLRFFPGKKLKGPDTKLFRTNAKETSEKISALLSELQYVSKAAAQAKGR